MWGLVQGLQAGRPAGRCQATGEPVSLARKGGSPVRAALLGWEVFGRAAVAGSWLQARGSRGKVWVL